MTQAQALAQGCGCQWAGRFREPAVLVLTVPDCPIAEHAQDARARIADPETPDEDWPDPDGYDRTAVPIDKD